jgi:hypothetical protein
VVQTLSLGESCLSAIRLDPVLELLDAMLAGAVGTAIELTVSHFHAMPDDHASAVGAARRQGMDGTFKAVKHVLLIPHHHFKRLVILVSTDFAFGHFSSFPILSPT